MPAVESAEGPGARPDRPPAAEAAVIGVLTLVLIAGLYWWVGRGAPRPDEPAVRPLGSEASGGRLSEFMGDRACAECHPGESASHQRSGHAHTLRKPDEVRMTRRIEGRTVRDPEFPDTTWSFDRRDGKFSAERRAGDDVERFIVDFVFGSGEHAATFLTLTDRDPRHPSGLEHRLTYYPRSDSFGVTPGQKSDAPEGRLTPAGRAHGAAEVVHCFGCHTSTTSAEDPNVLDTATMIPNITCERCHGMGRTHVEAARRGETDLAMGFGSGRWTADGQMRLCGQCHRYPGVLEGVGAHQVHPSKVRADNPEIVRFQPIGLMQSACYVKSKGGLSCVTCHDPHRRASKDRNAYEAVCLSCHKVPSRSVCRVSPASGCVGCHMPARDAGQGVMFTDHWIRSREGPRAREGPGGH